MGDILLLLIGGIVGAVAGWVCAMSQSRSRRAALENRLATQEGSATAIRDELERGREAITRLQGDLRTLTAEKAEAEARLDETRAGLEEQKRTLDEAKTRLTDAFRALAAEALQSSNEGFLQLAEQRFKALTQEATGELEARKTAVETIVQPLQQALEAYQKEAKELE